MKRASLLGALILLAACTPTPPELPEGFDPTFAFFIAQD